MYRLPGVTVQQITMNGEEIIIDAAPAAASAVCPACQQPSARMHSRSVRRLRDLPACGRPVRVRLAVRRFFCRTATCPKRTFAEQVPAVTAPHRQQLARLEAVLAAFSAALGGQAGARLLRQIGVAVSGSTLLRALRRADPPAAATPRVLGVDEWAWRRGVRYGAVLVDLEARRPVDLLAEATAAGLERWLRANPGVEVVVRDRSTDFARGARQGAPGAVQVVDRWHVLRNVREVAERLLQRASRDLRHLADGAAPWGAPRYQSAADLARRQRERERAAALHAAVQALAAAGVSIRGIARQLGIARGTARKYRAAAAAPERARPRFPSALDPFEPYLRRRWAEGCQNALQLWRELRERGYAGGSRPVSRWAQLRRPADATGPRPGRPRTTPAPHRAGGRVRTGQAPVGAPARLAAGARPGGPGRRRPRLAGAAPGRLRRRRDRLSAAPGDHPDHPGAAGGAARRRGWRPRPAAACRRWRASPPGCSANGRSCWPRWSCRGAPGRSRARSPA